MYVIIEHDPVWQQIMSKILNEAEDEHHMVASWKDLESQPPSFEPKIVIFDPSPYAEDLGESLEGIRQLSGFSSAPLVAYTHGDDRELVEELLANGFSSYFNKKETPPQKLLESVRIYI